MIDISIVLAVVIVVLCIVLNQTLMRKWRKYPPGPVGIPIIGNLHQLASFKEPSDAIEQWKNTYGDIVGAHFGQYRVVILNGYETIKEAFSMREFSGRPLLKPFHAIAGGEKRGLLLSEGQAWTEQRRFALKNLRDFGFGKKSMESLIHEDIEDLINHFKELEGKPFTPHGKFSTAVVKSLWNIIAGERFAYGDPKFQSVLDSISSITSSTAVFGPVFFLPWLADLLPGITGWNNFRKTVESAKSLIREYITKHQKSFQPDNLRDFIDVYLKEIDGTTDPNSSFYKSTGEKQMLVGTLNLFAAGSETTSSTIIWTLLYLINNPRVQEKLYQEIKSVIGVSRLPSLEDRDLCPYTHAVMEEVLRISSLVPLSILHSTMETITFRGYCLPKDTLVMANLYGVHMDKEIWGDPESFRPERFLNDDDGSIKKDAGPVMAFSVGKRACLGETLARNNFFLYLTSLIQKFEFKCGDAKEKAEIKTTPGLLRTPVEFSVIIKERDTN